MKEWLKTRSNRLKIYSVMAVLLACAILANVCLYQREARFVLARPVDASELYCEAQVGIARGYLQLEAPEQLRELEATLDRELAISHLESTFAKIEAIAIYLLQQAEVHVGMPTLAPMVRSGLDAFEAMLDGSINLWSDAIARVYVSLANVGGIPSRLVKVTGGPHQESHWLAESYVSEQDRWTLVDLRYRKLHLQNCAGEAMSAAELLAAIENEDLDHFDVALFEGGSVVHRPLSDHSAPEQHFFSFGASLDFLRPADLQPSTWRKVVSYLSAPAKIFTLRHDPFVQWGWVKMGLLASTGLVGIAFSGLLLRDISK